MKGHVPDRDDRRLLEGIVISIGRLTTVEALEEVINRAENALADLKYKLIPDDVKQRQWEMKLKMECPDEWEKIQKNK